MNEAIVRPEVALSEDWMILVFLFALVTLAYTRRYHPLRISRLWNSTWNVRILRQAIREEPNTPRANLLFNLSFFLMTALVIYLIVKYYHLTPLGLSGFPLYLLLIGGVAGAYLIKTLSIRFVQMIADGDYGLTEYEYNVFLINRVIGLLLFPVTLFLAYSPLIVISPFVTFALVVFIIMIIYRMFRGLFNAAGSGVPLFYIFFYICTLEILPLLVFTRALLS
jgi:Domain of unknown function (DUF4271)